MDRIKKAKEWIKTHPQDVMVILTATAISVQILYTGYSLKTEISRKNDMKRYRKAFESAVASDKDVRINPNGTIDIIQPKK